MKYKYGSRRKASEYEKDWTEKWKQDGTFEKSVAKNPESESYVFYDGPPFITGNPHYGTLLPSIVKDAVPRYQTMRGKRVERVWGWDCHGLPAENYVEKQLGITDRRDIGTKISLEKYITTARESMVQTGDSWESTIDRIGRWVDFKGGYKTMDKDFMESVWWAFKELYDKGKIYEGEKVLMYDTKFASPVSKNEVTMDNDAYQTVTDPSVFVKFKIDKAMYYKKLMPVTEGTIFAYGDKESEQEADEKHKKTIEEIEKSKSMPGDISLLAWTTTPWTLPANMALAVWDKLDYSEVSVDDGRGGKQRLIIAKALIEKVLVDDRKQPLKYDSVINKISGSRLDGLSYEPLPVCDNKYSYRIMSANFVSDQDGTGIVHIAPAYGEDDFAMAQKNKIPVKHVIDDEGYYLPEAAEQLRKIGVRDTDENGIEVWTANKIIAKCLEEAGIVWKIDYVQHEYPFNPRSKQRIMYRAIPSWFFDVDGSKELMLAQNENINWYPEHFKEGRFKKNIEQAPDWNLSRNRFWATAMPVWKGDKGTVKVVGSYAELKELSGVELEDYHRPWVDDITFEIKGEKFTRVEEVLDCWFESGSMPFAQVHYPFENKEKFETNYPADFIVEYVGQIRAWFYYLHVVNTALFGSNSFKNAIVTGTIAGNDGRKMSKSLGNFTDPNILMDEYSADSLRFLLLSSPLLAGEDFALKDKDVSDVARKLAMIWNMYDFFTMYAEVDGWEYKGWESHPKLEELKNPLDIWIISRLHELKADITKNMDDYNIQEAMVGILPFVDDASNWFVRRSRRRFWKSDSDEDKNEAYSTLHWVLSRLAVLVAPFVPFLAEELWTKMVGEDSVHLQNWPTNISVNQKVLDDMARTRGIITEGLALRMEREDEFGQIKIRQPLAKLTYPGEKLDDFYEQIILEEVNIKEVSNGKELVLDKNITPELKREGLSREVIRAVQKTRKDAGLNVDDRIILSLTTDDAETKKAVSEYSELIAAETLATELADGELEYSETVKIDSQELKISLKKA